MVFEDSQFYLCFIIKATTEKVGSYSSVLMWSIQNFEED